MTCVEEGKDSSKPLKKEKDEIVSAAKKNENVKKFLSNKKLIKVIFIEKKLINFVVK